MEVCHTPKLLGITGGTGLIGSRLIEKASERGYRVRSLSRSHKGTGPASDMVEPVSGDITDSTTLRDFVHGLDYLIHLAAYVGSGPSSAYRSINVQGTRNICTSLLTYNPECPLLYCSSITVLRRHRKLTWCNTQYAESKFAAEQQVRAYERLSGLRASYVYPGLVYGPNDNRLIPILLRAIKQGKVIDVSGGERWAPLIYVDDLCDLILHIVSRTDHIGRSYIGVGRQEVGIQGLVRILGGRIDAKPPRTKLPRSLVMAIALALETVQHLSRSSREPSLSRRVVDVLSINLDPGTVRAFNGKEWHAQTPLSVGLDRTFDWLASTNSPVLKV